MFGIDSGAGVGDGDACETRGIAIRGDGETPLPWRHALHRIEAVSHQVEDDLLHLDLVDADRQGSHRQRQVQLDAQLAGFAGGEAGCFPHQIAHICRFSLHLAMAEEPADAQLRRQSDGRMHR